MTQDPYQFLEQLQEHIYSQLGEAPQVFPGDFLLEQARLFLRARRPTAPAEEIEKDAEELVRDMEEGPAPRTRFEHPGWYGILHSLSNWIETSVQTMGLPMRESPAFGSLPTGQVNAMTIAVPNSADHLVLFEDQLFIFALLFSKALARALPVRRTPEGGLLYSVDKDEVADRIRAKKDVVERFADVVLAYSISGRPSNARQYYVESEYFALSDTIRESMECFVLGHEYGHVIGMHLGEAARSAGMLAADEVDEINYNWMQEHEADIYGTALTLQSIHRERRIEPAMCFIGVDTFFSAMDVMDKATSLLRSGDENATTLGSHPPSSQRREVTRRFLDRILDPEHARSAVELAESLQFAMEQLWSATRPLLMSAMERGATAAPRWSVRNSG
ncbi:hypothetical protein GCM10011512_16380 [Tersicoccus solisilvae]|uniref:Peptidase M48 domain-containing protein n=1 Tax=Tersicoccus solisilvae TaxID=1882339 RepID=A0ABQ1P730_9MICC|nr:hypothetical protein [Tersicoccus solisilvae]GGC90166.1 hypothetical protein GCM10011512_16380 [Tersicoccus solisilvae]